MGHPMSSIHYTSTEAYHLPLQFSRRSLVDSEEYSTLTVHRCHDLEEPVAALPPI